MSIPPPNETFSPEGPGTREPRKGPGCLFYGCVTMIVLAVLAAGGMYAGYRFVKGKLGEYVEAYTEPAPRPLPKLGMSDEDRQAAIKRAKDYKERIEAPPTADNPRVLDDDDRTLVLSADDINALIDEQPELKDHLRVTIDGDEAKALISMPMPDVPLLRGRYLNGEAKVVPTLVDGDVHFMLRDIRVKGKPLPEELRAGFENKDLMQEAAKNPNNQNQLSRLTQNRKFDTIDVKDGKLVVVARKEPNHPSGSEEEPAKKGEPKSKEEMSDDDDMPKDKAETPEKEKSAPTPDDSEKSAPKPDEPEKAAPKQDQPEEKK